MRYFTCHWRYKYWRPEHNREFVPLAASGSNLFTSRGVEPGHAIYVVTINEGQLYLGARMIVDKIVSRVDAVQIRGNSNLYPAKQWAIAKFGSSTKLNLGRRLSADVTHLLRFGKASSAAQPLCFKTFSLLDGQAIRGIRELTAESADLLDRIISISDSDTKHQTVTFQMLNAAEREKRTRGFVR